ncbi:MAG: hypothetical protein Q8R12_02945 [bacterium]|nr:hypothetical protein [bacterium]
MQFVSISEAREGGVLRNMGLSYGNYFAPRLFRGAIGMPTQIRGGTICPISGGKQFLYKAGSNLYWGGLDEACLFLNRVSSDIPARLEEADGEPRFFEAIKPPIIRFLEEVCGKRGSSRQGDINIYHLPSDWRGLNLLKKALPLPCHGRILRTHHIHSGFRLWCYAGDYLYYWVRGGVMPSELESSVILIASGWLRAPDHKTVLLLGPSVLARSAYLLTGD